MTSFALLLFVAPSAFAQGIDLTASLDATDGLARIGYYVPVTLAATNHTDRAVAEVRVATGGPVETRAPWFLAPGQSGETVVPVFYAGGDLALEVTLSAKAGGDIARVRPRPPEVRPLPEGVVFYWLEPGTPKPDEQALKGLRDRYGVKAFRFLRADDVGFRAAARCGLVDVCECGPAGAENDRPSKAGAGLPPSAAAPVQPETFALFGPPDKPPGRTLWLWLAVLTGAVVVVAVAVPARRGIVAALALVVVGLGAAALLWIGAGVREARMQEARLTLVDLGSRDVASERLVLLQSRGGAPVHFALPPRKNVRWPVPVFPSAEAVFRPTGTLVLGEAERFEARLPRTLLHYPQGDDAVLGRLAPLALSEDLPAKVADRADVSRALWVEGDRATDADGRCRPIDAWAVAWKTGDDPALAWAGRGLAWWARHRRTTDGPVLVYWTRDPAPAPPPGIDVYERLPAMVVCKE